MNTTKKCLNCNKNIDSSTKALQCDNCSGYIHHNCVNIPIDDIHIFTRSRAKGFRFVCKTCAGKPAELNKRNPQIFGQANVSTLDSQSELSEIKSLLLDLKCSIDNINERLLHLESNINSSSPLSADIYEDLVAETIDRINRTKNIVVVGVPETIDNTEVVDNIKSVCGAGNVSVVKAYRVGKKQVNKPRLVKIELLSSRDAFQILKDKNRLKDSVHSNYIIKRDETPRQRDYLKSLRSELDKRLREGEQNLTIKYIRGIPKIVGRD